jgi:flagellin-like protein
MRKLLKGKKALSPVIAAIIMIAVTVAVSIAVAAWMGALTFTFMKTEELRITTVTFQNPSGSTYNNATISFRNTGASSLTIVACLVDDAQVGSDLEIVVPKGTDGSHVASPSGGFTAGAKYTLSMLTSAGNRYTYTTTAAPA